MRTHSKYDQVLTATNVASIAQLHTTASKEGVLAIVCLRVGDADAKTDDPPDDNDYTAGYLDTRYAFTLPPPQLLAVRSSCYVQIVDAVQHAARVAPRSYSLRPCCYIHLSTYKCATALPTPPITLWW